MHKVFPSVFPPKETLHMRNKLTAGNQRYETLSVWTLSYFTSAAKRPHMHTCVLILTRTLLKKYRKVRLAKNFLRRKWNFYLQRRQRLQILPQAADADFLFSFLFAVVFAGPKRKTKIKHTHKLGHTQESKAKLSAIELKFSLRNFFVFVCPPFVSLSFHTLCIL